MSYYTVTEDHQADPLLTVAPLALPGVKVSIAADMARTGHGTHCGQCGKPFNLARKPRGIARVRHVAPTALHTTTWLLCGRCLAEMRRNGNQVSPSLLAEARAATDAGRVLLMPAKGGMQ
jgi:hypothetical protein